MSELETGVATDRAGAGDKPVLSSRTSRAAAGWIDCHEAASLTDLYREDYVPKAFRWVDPRPIWQSRNDRIARWIDDPTDDERVRWVEAQRRKGVDTELTVTRYAQNTTLTFIVLGDPGEGDASQYHVLRPALSKADEIDFTYICSDVIYPAGDINEYYDKFYWPYQKLPGPIYAIPGNHDWYDGLHGFMAHFCGADADLRPPQSSKTSRWRRVVRDRFWRRPSEPEQDLIEEMTKLRKERSDQPGPYFAIDSEPLLVVGIDTGIQGRLDQEQGRWLEQISKVPKPKILISGKPLVVDAREKSIPIGGSGSVKEIVDRPEHQYIAVIGGDIHNFQRYPVRLDDGRTIQHIVSGAAGAYTKATHKIPKVEAAKCGCTEEEFRCYPRRGDSLAAYSRLYDKRLGFDRGYLVVPYQQAPAIMRELLDGNVEPTRRADVDVEITQQAWKAAKRITKFPGSAQGPFHQSFSEILDWNDPPPPLFKSFLRVEASEGEVEIRCYAATGCKEHQDNPPLEDHIKGRRQGDGNWSWEVVLE